MIKYNKSPLQSFFITSKFEKHIEIKNKLLRHFEYSNNENVVQIDNYYSDNISKLDWSQRHNFERPWTKLLREHMEPHMNSIFGELGYDNCLISELWFQQYHRGDTHGWHIHGCNFTAVYYVELTNQTPVTEFVCPYDQNSISKFNVEEGDVIFFPSYVIHRAPPVQDSDRKTIVSFNINLNLIKSNVLKSLKK
jgi:hypothetical protein